MDTKSLFWTREDDQVGSKDENGNLAEGQRVFITENGKQVFVRFRNGYLDGDVFNENGELEVKPAVETTGHLEYWREGKLHRDDGLPAVISDGFAYKEWWENNKRIDK